MVVRVRDDKKTYPGEGPAERGFFFLDGFIAQLSSAYLRDLIDYRRVLKPTQNALLGWDYRMEPGMWDAGDD